MEIVEEFTELVTDLNNLSSTLNLKKFKDNKEEIYTLLERMTELLDELEIDEDEELDIDEDEVEE